MTQYNALFSVSVNDYLPEQIIKTHFAYSHTLEDMALLMYHLTTAVSKCTSNLLTFFLSYTRWPTFVLFEFQNLQNAINELTKLWIIPD